MMGCSMVSPKPVIDRIIQRRECGNVERCHTLPHVGVYDVKAHSFNCMVLLDILHPGATKTLMRALMYHDFAERWVGDLPAPAKWFNQDVREAHRVAELACEEHFQIPQFKLEDEDIIWLEGIDRLELFIWSKEQYGAWGNRNVMGCIRQLDRWFLRRQHSNQLPQPVWDVYMDYVWTRGPEQPDTE